MEELLRRKLACSAKILFITEFPGSMFLLPAFLTGSKCDFQGANLLLATVYFEPYSYQLITRNYKPREQSFV